MEGEEMDMMQILFILFGIAVILLVGINGQKTIGSCQNVRCEWQITNCCPENAGAYWKCINVNTFTPPECGSEYVCPQFISPKPTANCACTGGICVKGL